MHLRFSWFFSRYVKNLHWFKVTVCFLLSTSFLIILVQAYGLYETTRLAEERAIEEGNRQTSRILRKLRAVLQRIEMQTNRFAEDLRTGKIDQDNLLQQLKDLSLRDRYLLGFTVAFAPGAYSKERKLYAPFFDARSGKVIQCEDFYDYSNEANQKNAAWYLEPVKNSKSEWVTGFGPAANATYAGFSVPVYKTETDDKKPKLYAVVNGAFSLEVLSSFLNKTNVGRLGTSIMLDEKGVIIGHANRNVLNSGKTWIEILKAKKLDDSGILRVPDLMGQGKSGHFHFNNFAGFDPPQSGWFFYEPVPETKWSLGVAILRNELYSDNNEFRHRIISLTINGILFISLLVLLVVRLDRFDILRISLLAVVFSLASLMAIGLIWGLTVYSSSRKLNDYEEKIDDLSGEKDLIDRMTKQAESQKQPLPRFIPTRIYVRTIEFENSHNVKLSGVVWQTYDLKSDEDLKRGFLFPDITPDAEGLFMEEVFRESTEGKETVGWVFRATLRQDLSFDHYPFDMQRLTVALKHIQQDKNVILVPDLISYRFINSSARPGLHHKVILPGWHINGCYFSYQNVRYDVAFGLPGSESDLGQFPELHYNIVLRRAFITPFISHIVPISIVVFLLYGVVIISSFNEKKQAAYGYNVFGVLGTCGAFFFTIALMHIDLRSQLDLDVITYLEALYIIAYVLLLVVSTNSMLFIITDAVPAIEYRDNIIAKLLYWPLFLTMVLGVTVATFY